MDTVNKTIRHRMPLSGDREWLMYGDGTTEVVGAAEASRLAATMGYAEGKREKISGGVICGGNGAMGSVGFADAVWPASILLASNAKDQESKNAEFRRQMLAQSYAAKQAQKGVLNSAATTIIDEMKASIKAVEAESKARTFRVFRWVPPELADERDERLDAAMYAFITSPNRPFSVREGLRRLCATASDAPRITDEQAVSALAPPEARVPAPPRAKPALAGFDVTAAGDHRPGLWRAVEG